MNSINITDKEFSSIQSILYDKTGIFLNESKRYLVSNRLNSRILSLNLTSVSDYLKILKSESPDEVQIMIDRLTTNETFFFREEKHFKFLKKLANSDRYNKNFRIWSAACSTGEEVYSIAMILEEAGVMNWKIVGSDINETVIQTAIKGVYPIERSDNIPENFLKKYCYKGINSNKGKFRIDSKLKSKIEFFKINLSHQIPEIGVFDLIFLRNVMIYFDTKSKEKVLDSIIHKLKDGGYLILSHTESLMGLANDLQFEKIGSSIYKKK
ncbi:MAG: protein-glutamate O-methyltransferase CheR [Spirochaetes bacterium]|nr:protein-glutamate O-methyltransferase CheR [Spirochaetota bacterium]